MNKLIILYGLPGSGKTTFSNEYCANNPNTIHLNRDLIRAMFNSKWSKELEDVVKNTEYSTMYKALESGFDVILDDVSNLNPSTYSIIMTYVKELETKLNCKIEIVEKCFNVPLDECIRRDASRVIPVGEKVIKDFHHKYNPILEAKENAKHLEKFNSQNKDCEHAIIIDIDKTIALNTTGRPWYGKGAAEGMLEDIPIDPIIKHIVKQYPYKKLFVTGRDDGTDIAAATQSWLQNNGLLDDNSIILFRHENDCRTGVEVKEEIFLNEIKDKYFIDFVLEDSKKISAMYYKYGLFVLSPFNINE